MFELVAQLRRELARRGEALSAEWVEGAVTDLRSGALPGWFLPPSSGPGGIAFFSVRPRRAFGHVHVEPGERTEERVVALVRAMVDGLPASVRRLDTGVTGLTEPEEEAVRPGLDAIPGGSTLRRWALQRPLAPDDAREPPLPEGMRRVPVREVPLETLQALDRLAYGTTPDATLFADTREENLRVLQEILDGRLGVFLDAASTALASDTGHLVGALLTAEENPHRGIFLDLSVAPEFQRRGLATYLLRFGFRALLALGYDTATLWVTESNAPATALYGKLGFRRSLASTLFTYSREGAAQPQTSR